MGLRAAAEVGRLTVGPKVDGASAEVLRARTEAGLAREAEGQVKKALEAMNEAADAGRYEVTFKGELNSAAQACLRSGGIEVTAVGGGYRDDPSAETGWRLCWKPAP